MPKGVYLRRPWLAEEDRIVDRYVEALHLHRYRTSRRAAEECAREFQRLHAGQPERSAGTDTRSLAAIEYRMYQRAYAAGYVRWRYSVTSEDEAVYDRYARALARGH